MESIGSTFLMTFILVMGLFYFITAHSLSVIARKTDHGDTAEILAYIPGLQIFPTLWVGGMSVFRTLLMAIAFGIANALLTVAASKVD